MVLVPRVYDCEFSIVFFFFFVTALASSLGEARSRATATEIILLNIGLPSTSPGSFTSRQGRLPPHGRSRPSPQGPCHSVHLWLTGSAEQPDGHGGATLQTDFISSA